MSGGPAQLQRLAGEHVVQFDYADDARQGGDAGESPRNARGVWTILLSLIQSASLSDLPELVHFSY